jgi:hypothetical protein
MASLLYEESKRRLLAFTVTRIWLPSFDVIRQRCANVARGRWRFYYEEASAEDFRETHHIEWQFGHIEYSVPKVRGEAKYCKDLRRVWRVWRGGECGELWWVWQV